MFTFGLFYAFVLGVGRVLSSWFVRFVSFGSVFFVSPCAVALRFTLDMNILCLHFGYRLFAAPGSRCRDYAAHAAHCRAALFCSVLLFGLFCVCTCSSFCVLLYTAVYLYATFTLVYVCSVLYLRFGLVGLCRLPVYALFTTYAFAVWYALVCSANCRLLVAVWLCRFACSTVYRRLRTVYRFRRSGSFCLRWYCLVRTVLPFVACCLLRSPRTRRVDDIASVAAPGWVYCRVQFAACTVVSRCCAGLRMPAHFVLLHHLRCGCLLTDAVVHLRFFAVGYYTVLRMRFSAHTGLTGCAVACRTCVCVYPFCVLVIVWTLRVCGYTGSCGCVQRGFLLLYVYVAVCTFPAGFGLWFTITRGVVYGYAYGSSGYLRTARSVLPVGCLCRLLVTPIIVRCPLRPVRCLVPFAGSCSALTAFVLRCTFCLVCVRFAFRFYLRCRLRHVALRCRLRFAGRYSILAGLRGTCGLHAV